MSDTKTRMIDGIEWEEDGPYCEICGAHMGKYYNSEHDPCFINPHNYEDFSNNVCPECGQKYSYEEGNMPVLDEEVIDFILAHNKAKLEGKK